MKQNMRQKNMQAYLFLSPFLVFITVLYILPAILTVIMAFTSLDSAFIWKFNGINNFRKILMDPNTPIIAWNTVKYVGITIFLTVVLDLFFAIMTTYFIRDERKGNIFKGILMIPMITPAVVYSVLWLWLLEATPNGLANKVYMALGGSEPLNWIAQYPFVIIIAATLLTSIAYGTTVFSSAVKSIPENHSAQPALPHHLYRPVGDPGSAHQLCHHHAHHQRRPGCPDRGMGTECLPQGLLGQPVRLWCCHFAGADRGGYGADACDRRCDAPSGKIPFLRNQEVRYEIFPETQV